MDAAADLDGDVGPLDEAALEQIRTTFANVDGLVADVGFDDLLDPTKLVVHLDDGIGAADWARFDVRWYRRGYYNVHHTDERDVDFRFDYHPKPNAPDRHFHEPPDARSGNPVASCITVREPRLVARAVHLLWRRAYDTNSLTGLNAGDNPP